MRESGEQITLTKDVPGMKKVKQMARAILPPYLSSEVRNQENLIRLKELQAQGYSTVYIYDHFSARDPIQILKFILDNKLAQDKEICFPMEARLYNNSKLMNFYFAKELYKRGVDVHVCCPGLCNTDFFRAYDPKFYHYILFSPVILFFLRSAEQGD